MRHRWIIPFLACVFALTGCKMEKRVVYNPWQQLEDLADKPKDSPVPGATTDNGPDNGWTILLETFEGEGREKKATKLSKKLTKAGMPHVWVKQVGVTSVVYRGLFSDPATLAARAELDETRAWDADGFKSYEAAELISISGALAGNGNKLDLKQYSGQDLYTLQVAAFDPDFGKEFRKAAEDYAAQLRAKGDEAYFYHGPNMSLVTIGVFSNDDWDEVDVVAESRSGPVNYKQKVYGERIHDVQSKHPLNIYNGYTVKETQPDGTVNEQQSLLVIIK